MNFLQEDFKDEKVDSCLSNDIFETLSEDNLSTEEDISEELCESMSESTETSEGETEDEETEKQKKNTEYETLDFFREYGAHIKPFYQNSTISNPRDSTPVVLKIEAKSKTKLKNILSKLLNDPLIMIVEALIISIPKIRLTPLEMLARSSKKLPNLKGLFLDSPPKEDILEDCDLTFLLGKFSNSLIHLKIRVGKSGLSLFPVVYPNLKSLTIESASISKKIINYLTTTTFSNIQFPMLERLELFLGMDDLMADSYSISDLEKILNSSTFPSLKHLGLRNSNQTDQIVEEILCSGILPQLTTLDLSLGTLSNEGAKLLTGLNNFQNLKTLDIHHHYCSRSAIEELASHLITSTHKIHIIASFPQNEHVSPIQRKVAKTYE